VVVSGIGRRNSASISESGACLLIARYEYVVFHQMLAHNHIIEQLDRGMLLRRLFMTSASVTLEREAQPELDLPRGTERVNACADTDTIDVVATGIGSIDLPRCTCQQSIQRHPW
jgi:hypothetical protein